MSADGGPAFPVPAAHVSGTDCYPQEGMSLRDYFAAKALQGFIASNHATAEWISAHAVTSSYSLADAMLAERARQLEREHAALIADARLGQLVREKMVSGNAIPVERCTITADEIVALSAATKPQGE